VKTNVRLFLLIVSILTILAGTATADLSKEGSAETGPQKIKVFILQSYEQDHVCGTPQGKGIETALAKEFNGRLDIRAHFMNTKTINSAPDIWAAHSTG
jgi:hypothetical protein